MALNPDLREFVELLNSKNVEYLIIGAHAVAFHARPRYTGDLDLFVGTAPGNAALVLAALKDFGFGDLSLTVDDFGADRELIQLGYAPNRLDLLPTITDVTFEEAWNTRVRGKLDGLDVHFISRDLLLKNKRATARPIDMADVSILESSN